MVGIMAELENLNNRVDAITADTNQIHSRIRSMQGEGARLASMQELVRKVHLSLFSSFLSSFLSLKLYFCYLLLFRQVLFHYSFVAFIFVLIIIYNSNNEVAIRGNITGKITRGSGHGILQRSSETF